MVISEVVPPAGEADLDAVFELYAQSFPPSYFQAKAHFDVVRRCEPPVPLENYFLVRGPDGEVAGALRLVERTMLLDGVALRLAGISHYAIAPVYQRTECAVRILKALFERVKGGGYDLSLAIARKVTDGYWSRFGFFGLAGFCSFTVNTRDLRRAASDGTVHVRPMGDGDAEHCARLHENTYATVSGAIVRDAGLWAWCYEKVRGRRDMTWHILEEGARVVGYAVMRGDTILEVAVEPDRAAGCLAALAGAGTHECLHLTMPPSHPVAMFLRRFNYTFSHRRVWDGGHVVRVTDWWSLLVQMRPVLERRLANARVSPFWLSVNRITLMWDGRLLALRSQEDMPCADNVSFDESEWPKVLLGVEPVTAMRGFRATGSAQLIEVLFPVLWAQLAELDEF
jgi:hypothetical protein